MNSLHLLYFGHDTEKPGANFPKKDQEVTPLKDADQKMIHTSCDGEFCGPVSNRG